MSNTQRAILARHRERSLPPTWWTGSRPDGTLLGSYETREQAIHAVQEAREREDPRMDWVATIVQTTERMPACMDDLEDVEICCPDITLTFENVSICR